MITNPTALPSPFLYHIWSFTSSGRASSTTLCYSKISNRFMRGVASLVLHTRFFPYLQLSLTFPEAGRQESLQILCIKGASKSPKLLSVPIPYLSLKKVSHWYNGYWEAYHVTLENKCNWFGRPPTIATFNQHL